jgi:hypothetical protein
MMSILKIRLPKAFIIIGLTLLIFSSLGDPHWDRRSSVHVGNGSYGVCLFSTTCSISMKVEDQDNKRFSLYVVTYSDALEILNTTSLENVTPILIRENITSFNQIVEIWSVGIYGIVVTPTRTSQVTVSVRLRVIYPQNTTFVPGLILASAGLLIIGLPEIWFLLQNLPNQDVKPIDS